MPKALKIFQPILLLLILAMVLTTVQYLCAGEGDTSGKAKAKIEKPAADSLPKEPFAGDWGEWIFRMEESLTIEIPFATMKEANHDAGAKELRLRLTFIKSDGKFWYLRAQAANGLEVWDEEEIKINAAAFWKGLGDFSKPEVVAKRGASLRVFAQGRKSENLPCICEEFEIKDLGEKSYIIERWLVQELALKQPFKLGPAKLILPGMEITLVALGDGSLPQPVFPYNPDSIPEPESE